MDSTRQQLNAVAAWLRSGNERSSGINALPAHIQQRARQANERFCRMMRSRRSR